MRILRSALLALTLLSGLLSNVAIALTTPIEAHPGDRAAVVGGGADAAALSADALALLDDEARRRAEEAARLEEEARKRAEEERAAKIRAKVSRAGLSWPRVDMITSHFGPRRRGSHHGMDILCSPQGGEPIYAANNGRVFLAGPMGVYGNAVMIEHDPGTKTLYAHMWRVAVRPGEHVARGEVIGICGSTGNSTNPHLHFEYYRNGRPINPLHYLPSWD